MKAWFVQPKNEWYAGIVFAETRGQARVIALSLDGFEDTIFTDVEVRRAPYADKYYKHGKSYLDWDNPIERIALVKDCGFVCDIDYFEWEDCESCSAKNYCDRYQDHLRENEVTENDER